MTRPRLAVALAVLVALGLVLATRFTGALVDAAGDAAYAAAVTLAVLLVAPRLDVRAAGAVALAVCWIVELAQLTGGPAWVVARVPPARFVLGTTFVATDLIAYAVGVVVVVAAGRATSRRRVPVA
ncbi:DUF2809 domain-containing protein, partial [Cellulomonas sp. HZM]|uniref:DUF2809 domain-containing protein n=1 Tax=Cellulomonas sp. HZM TaxID=1454010 RepID=UPI000492FD1D